MESKVKCNVQIRNTKGELRWEGHNMTVAAGLDLLILLLAQQAGVTTYSGLNYCAIGTSSVGPDSSQTELVSEIGRNQFSSPIVVSGNQLSTQTFFPAASCSVVIQELGIFAMANGAVNSGTMYARAMALYDNSSLAEDLIVSWSLAIYSGD